MKTNLAPKHIRKIGDSIILWFDGANKYVVVSKSVWTLIQLFFEAKNKDVFNKQLEQSLQLNNATESQSIFNEISEFLHDVNAVEEQKTEISNTLKPPIKSIRRHYLFNTKQIAINYETEIIESLIHPQIEHRLVKEATTIDAEFDIFKIDDYLHLHKNKCYIGAYETKDFHLLQGRFALELTNTIHNKTIDNWIATFHASTVTNGKEAIMIVGDSGNGKSTLSALLMANGLDLLADDFTPLYNDLNLYRYPNSISIKNGAFNTINSEISNFKNLKTHTIGPKKVNLKYLPPNQIPDQNSNLVTSHFPCSTIIYVKFDKTVNSELNPISVEKILNTLIPDSWISPNELHAVKFLNWLTTVNCYELHYSDNDFAIKSFKRLIGD